MALAIAAFITGIFLTLAYQKFTGVFDKPRKSKGSGGGSSKDGESNLEIN